MYIPGIYSSDIFKATIYVKRSDWLMFPGYFISCLFTHHTTCKNSIAIASVAFRIDLQTRENTNSSLIQH